MNGLSKTQLSFLKDQNIHLKYVFDAKGLSHSEYKPIMKDLNKFIAFNVTPCKNFGHTLRTRSGHCCQCRTANIAFQKRHDSAGIVYIAGSIKGMVIKVGFSKAVAVRAESLIRTKYAGFNDWKILFALESKDAGKIETKSNSRLHDYIYTFDYEHDGHWQDSFETFHCSFSKAREFVIKTVDENEYSINIIQDSNSNFYEFRNLIKK